MPVLNKKQDLSRKVFSKKHFFLNLVKLKKRRKFLIFFFQKTCSFFHFGGTAIIEQPGLDIYRSNQRLNKLISNNNFKLMRSKKNFQFQKNELVKLMIKIFELIMCPITKNFGETLLDHSEKCYSWYWLQLIEIYFFIKNPLIKEC